MLRATASEKRKKETMNFAMYQTACVSIMQYLSPEWGSIQNPFPGLAGNVRMQTGFICPAQCRDTGSRSGMRITKSSCDYCLG